MTKLSKQPALTETYGTVYSSDKAKWQIILKDWQASGMSQIGFCARHGLNKHTLSYWRSKFLAEQKGQGLEKASKSASKLTPIKVVNKSSATNLEMLRIQTPNGYVLSLPQQVDITKLSKLLEILGGIHA